MAMDKDVIGFVGAEDCGSHYHILYHPVGLYSYRIISYDPRMSCELVIVLWRRHSGQK